MNRTEAGLRAALDNALNQPSPACIKNVWSELRYGKENCAPPKETPKKINRAQKKENIDDIPFPQPNHNQILKIKPKSDICTNYFSVAASGQSNQACAVEALLIDVKKRKVYLSIQ